MVLSPLERLQGALGVGEDGAGGGLLLRPDMRLQLGMGLRLGLDDLRWKVGLDALHWKDGINMLNNGCLLFRSTSCFACFACK